MLCLIIFDRFLSFQNRFETRQNFTMRCYLLPTVKLEHSTIPHFVITSISLMKNSLYFQSSLIKSITMSVALHSREYQLKALLYFLQENDYQI